MEYTLLSNGVRMPMLGYGVFKISNEDAEKCTLEAIRAGYRMIDTAQIYFNEEGVGRAIVSCGVPREELFITTKLWVSNFGYEKARQSIDDSLRRLQTDYVDLLLIHQPFGDYYGAWRAMEEAYRAGKVRAIGVSNFHPDRLVDLCSFVEIRPMVNQVESHVFYQQRESHAWMEKYGVKHQAWAPLAQANSELLTHPLLCAIGRRYGKTAAQVALRYLIQADVIVIPKTVTPSRMAENINVFDFTLDETEMLALAGLETGKAINPNHRVPEHVERYVALKAD